MSESVAAPPNGAQPADDGAARPPPDPFLAELRAGESTSGCSADGRAELALGRHSEPTGPTGPTSTSATCRTAGPSPGATRASSAQDDEWFLRVEPDAANPTLVGGQRVDPGQSIGLSHGQLIQLGGVWSRSTSTTRSRSSARPDRALDHARQRRGRPGQRRLGDHHGRQLHRPRRPVHGRGPRAAERVVPAGPERARGRARRDPALPDARARGPGLGRGRPPAGPLQAGAAAERARRRPPLHRPRDQPGPPAAAPRDRRHAHDHPVRGAGDPADPDAADAARRPTSPGWSATSATPRRPSRC